MLKKLIAVATAMLLAASVNAATPAPVVCDVTYTAEVETMEGFDVSSSSLTLRGVPMADVLDNSAKAIKVLDVLSKQQDKGGVYVLETGEERNCAGKIERVAATSVQLKGITLRGANSGARAALQQANLIVGRYESRAAKGDKQGWDHSKAVKVKRNDLGQKVK